MDALCRADPRGHSGIGQFCGTDDFRSSTPGGLFGRFRHSVSAEYPGHQCVFPILLAVSSYKNHVHYATVDRPDNKTIREIYISPASATVVKPGEPLPHGTVITMEVYRARVDENGEPVKDAEGRFIKGDLTGIFVMEKQPGWGADYPEDIRNGEWEYARFTAEGQRHSNADTTPCFQCHKPLGGQDFVFTQSQLLMAPK
jgi:Cytochrome P460